MGRASASRVRLTAELHEAAVRADEEREVEAGRAVADERRRIAREMHDVVAHSVSMMVIQAGGARRILDRDPARAVAAAALIERAGREALTEMRHLLGLLHAEDGPGRLRAAARRWPSSTRSSSGRARPGCRSSWRSSASGPSCPPGSTSPPTACCRRR